MSSKNFYGLTGDVTVDGGILNVGNAQLYANTETSNVGIGTSNPEFELDVRGDANVHNLYATYLHGDGSNIENIVSSQWEGSPGDPIYYASNVGIANTSPVTTTMQIGSNVVVDDVGSNVLHVTGNVYATRFIGDGAFLENIASSFQAITDNGNVTTNTVEFDGSTALVTTGSVGIANTAPVHDLNVGSNLYVEDVGSNVLHVTGNIYADYFVGDGSQLTGIAASLDQIVDQGNTVSNTIQLVSGQDAISNIGLVTHDGVGISVSNTNPTGEFQFGVGSNLLVNVYSSNVLTVDGNVFAQKMTLGTVTIKPAYNLQQITTTGATTNQTLILSNVTTGLTTTSNVGIANTAPVHTLDVGSNLYVEDTGSNVLTITGNAYVTERLNVGSNLHIENLQVAEVAANLVTYDATTGELMDSAGVFSNKLAVVSEQPPIALTGASTAVTSHGTYTIEASSTSSDSSIQYLFDKDEQTVWKTDNDPLKYTDGGVYAANASLADIDGEWVKITMPYKTILRHVKIESTNRSIKDVTLVGLNADGISWTTLKTVDGLNEETSTIIVNATTHHRTYGLIVEATNSGATQAEIGDLKLFTESFSIDGGKVAMASSAVMGGDTIMDQHGPHGRADVPLRKYPEIVFDASKYDQNHSTNTYTQAGYTATGSSQQTDAKNVAKLYDDKFPSTNDQESGWQSQNNTYDSSTGVALSIDTLTGITGSPSSRDGSYTTLELPHKIKLSYLQIHTRNSVDHGVPAHPKQVYVYGSNDGSSWTQVGSHLFTSVPATAIWQRIDINSTTPYKYFVLQATSILPFEDTNLNRVYILDLEWYGYEERSLGDTAVDTTFSSMYNTPDSTNMKAYGDASVSVSTPTNLVVGGSSTTGSSWTLDGSLTSNISLEANTFLEGDQPHTVSIWLNSSNLEANTSNSVIFSLGTEEVIRSDHVTLSANTWHNVTYAYQGEGGSKVTYVDGRKVAEDQAEDTFGEYPPFAMTGYSQGGYVVSASSEYLSDVNALRNAYKVYNATTDTAGVWMTDFGTFNPNAVGGNTFTDSDGGTHTGHWNKLELPYKLKPSYFYFKNSGILTSSRNATNWVILGSNNDSDWDLLHSSTVVLNTTLNIPITATKGYTYLMFLCKSINADTALYMDEIRFYGHRENDLVRLPDPTNVLKYPHIAMTGPAQRGYVASASSDNIGNNPAYKVFDHSTSDGWSTSGTYTPSGGFGIPTNSPPTLNGTGVPGEYLILQLPHKLRFSSVKLMPRNNNTDRCAESGNIYGSDDGTNWQLITSFSGKTYTSGNFTTIDINASTAYYRFAIVVTRIGNTANGVNTSIGEMELYGTGVDSVPIQIGGGNIDQVGNFRVYDAYLDKDRVEEIWDAHKDYYGRAKSSMTLHKGRLGIGTDTPLRTLDIVGDVGITSNTSIFVGSNTVAEYTGPHSRLPKTVPLKKFPEVVFDASKLDGNDTTNTYTQAGYTVSASSQIYLSTFKPWNTFDGNIGNEGWHSYAVPDSFTGTVGGANSYNGTSSLGGISGAWLKLELPHKIRLSSIDLLPRDYPDQQEPKDFKILGSNDDTNWVELIDVVGATWTQGVSRSFSVTGEVQAYKYLAISVSRVAGSSVVILSDLKYYGYEEDPPTGDTSVDTTFTSIMNTPQTTGANVYVDGNLGETFTNRVTGPTPTGTATTYDSTGKYWELTGALTSNVTLEANTFLEGDQPHAVSVWFNSSNLEANVSNTCVFSIASEEKLDSVNLDLQSNTWHNLTYAYQGEGGSRVTYLDGRKVAEDQAEDTFGDYPPFAMTGYSQGGYVASASSHFSTTDRQAWNAFDNNSVVSNPYRWVSDNYYVNGLYTRSLPERHIDVDGNVEDGEWLKLELPHKLKVSYFEIRAYPTNGSQSLRDYAILGSNDDSNWYQVQKVSGLGVGNGLTDGNIIPTGTYKNSAFKYFVFIWHNKANDVNGHVSMGELKFYGHRENDLVRLPDPTNVLKYPHIPLTNYPDRGGPGRRGYVATTSGAPNPAYAAQHAFNGVTVSGEGSWHSYAYYETDGGRLATRTPTSSLSSWTANGGSTTGELTTHTGEWVKIQLPHKIVLSSIILKQRTGVPLQKVRLFSIVGSNDDTNWFLVHQELTRSGTSTSLQEPDPNTMTGSYSNTAFKYFAIVIHAGVTDNTYDHVAIGEWELYGTGVDSIPIQIGGGNIDKVANFRVYDKFIDENQALEIWDAQKDAFGGAKSSMTLQKGRLGIGTTEPEGRLAVLDEPNIFEPRWPPKPLVGYNTYIEGYGEFVVHRSPNQDTGLYRSPSWWIFDDNQNTWNYTYHGEQNTSTNTHYFTGTNGTYIGNNSIGGIPGDWTVLESPKPIKINDIIRMRVRSTGQYTKGFIIAAANKFDGVWTKLTEQSNLVWQTGGVGESKTFHFENDTYYKYYAIIITQSQGHPTLSNMEFSGIVQQGQSVLHDGQLTLTKSLNVPRIGPALDADDTPRRDRLVVEYNTTTNPTFEGAVRDTSGRGLDGIMYNGASYDATEKALKFVGSSSTTANTSDKIQSTYDWGSTAPAHTFSVWFKRTANLTDWEWICSFGQANNTGGNPGILISADTHTEGGNIISFDIFNDQVTVQHTVELHEWTHVVATFNAASTAWSVDNCKIYVNGELKAGTNAVAGPFNLVGNEITLGATHEGKRGFTGCISNFKLYDCVLTAEEAKTLYDMGRCDEGNHVVNFSKTRVGIGLGDGEAPRGALDVRGDIYGGCPVFFDASASSSTAYLALMDFDNVTVNKGGALSGTTFTAPITGYYQFHIFCMGAYTSGANQLWVSFMKNDAESGTTATDARVYDNTTGYDTLQSHSQIAGSAIIYLTVGDYVQIKNWGSTAVHGSYNRFQGIYLSA